MRHQFVAIALLLLLFAVSATIQQGGSRHLARWLRAARKSTGAFLLCNVLASAAVPLSVAVGYSPRIALAAQEGNSNTPGFLFGSNVRLALEAYQENPESLTCNLDNQNIKGDESSCQQLDAVVRLRAGHLITMKQDWGGSVSTGASVWNGENVAVWYMEHVLAPQGGIKGKRVIELGSGVGFSGVAASLLGASNVLITDGNEDVLRLADTNILNNVESANQGGAGSPKIRTARLRWNTADEDAFVSKDGSTQSWDLVLASDLTYLKKNWPDLVHSIKALSGPTTRTILSMEPRNVGEVEGVLDELVKNGLRWDEAVLPPAIHGDLCDLSCPRLFVVTLSAP